MKNRMLTLYFEITSTLTSTPKPYWQLQKRTSLSLKTRHSNNLCSKIYPKSGTSLKVKRCLEN